MVIQRSYSINPDRGYPGMIAEPNSPMRIERGVLNIPAAATRQLVRPGDSVFYNSGDNAWQVADNNPNQLVVAGILTYPADTVANADSELILASGAEVEVVTMGVVWVYFGGAVERNEQVHMAVGTGNDAFQYVGVTRVTATADMYTHPIECYEFLSADNTIGKVAIGYGRAI